MAGNQRRALYHFPDTHSQTAGGCYNGAWIFRSDPLHVGIHRFGLGGNTNWYVSAGLKNMSRNLRAFAIEERNHQGLQNRLLKCSDGPINLGSRVERREKLGGMLNFYHREAA